MSEFENLKDKAEDYAQQHPEQVRKGEQTVEDRLGMDQGGNQQDAGEQQHGGQQGSGQQDDTGGGPDSQGQ